MTMHFQRHRFCVDSQPDGYAAVGRHNGPCFCRRGFLCEQQRQLYLHHHNLTAHHSSQPATTPTPTTKPSPSSLTTTGINGLQLGSPTTVVVGITDDDTADCHTWQQFDPDTNTCVNRPFLS